MSMLTRRMLLPLLSAGAASTLAACGGVPGGIEKTAALPDVKTDPEATAKGTVVVVFQRFAADWLNLLVPAGDANYGPLRPQIAINNPLPLDSFFGLHPAMQPLLPIWEAGDLGFVAATGWIPTDSRDRSHFYAQTLAESGARSGVADGWLSRAMHRDSADNIFAALAAESAIPNSLQGYAGAIALRDFGSFNHGSVMGDAATALVESLATTAGDPGATVKRLAQGIRAIEADPPTPSTAAYPGTNLGQGLKVAAEAIKNGLAPRVITVTSDDDWDTHVSQVSRHNASVPNFAKAIATFYEDMGDLMENVTLVTMTEFGRKARENFGGTDHGTASSMLVMGKKVAGKKVYGQWPGLNDSALYQGEDLEPATDYRSVLSEILNKQMGLSQAAVDAVFPGGYSSASLWRNFMR